MRKIALFAVVIAMASCGGAPPEDDLYPEDYTTETQEKDPYEMMSTAFEGFPQKEDVKKLIDPTMEMYGLEVNNDNLESVGSMLVELRKASAVNVTEMEILKHMYQHGDTKQTIQNQAAMSLLILEKTK